MLIIIFSEIYKKLIFGLNRVSFIILLDKLNRGTATIATTDGQSSGRSYRWCTRVFWTLQANTKLTRLQRYDGKSKSWLFNSSMSVIIHYIAMIERCRKY